MTDPYQRNERGSFTRRLSLSRGGFEPEPPVRRRMSLVEMAQNDILKSPEEQSESKAVGVARKAGQAVSNFASQFNRVIKGDNEREFTQQELTEFMSNDPMLWFEFKREVSKQQSFTEVRVPEVLNKFIEENKEEIIRSGLAAAAQKAAAEAPKPNAKRRPSLSKGWKSTSALALQGVSSMFAEKKQERHMSCFVKQTSTRMLFGTSNSEQDEDNDSNDDEKSEDLDDYANGDASANKSSNGTENNGQNHTFDDSLLVGWGRSGSYDDEDGGKECQNHLHSEEDFKNQLSQKVFSDFKRDSFSSVGSTPATSVDGLDSDFELDDDENLNLPTQRLRITCTGSRRNSMQSIESIKEEDADDLESVGSIG